MARAHRHDDVELTLAMGGHAVMDHGGRRHEFADGTALIFWAGIPHQLIDTDPDVSIRWLTVPLIDVLAWPIPEALSADLLRGAAVIPPVRPSLTGQMATWAAEIGTDPALTEAAQYEVRALFLRIGRRNRPVMGSRGDSPADPAATPSAGRHAATIAAFIATHCGEPLQVADIARAVNLHPSTAGAVFRNSTGVTMGQYLTQCRIAEAQRLLIATDRATTDIALRAGFGSTSRFYAAFLEHCHLAPAAYRRALRGMPPRDAT